MDKHKSVDAGRRLSKGARIALWVAGIAAALWVAGALFVVWVFSGAQFG